MGGSVLFPAGRSAGFRVAVSGTGLRSLPGSSPRLHRVLTGEIMLDFRVCQRLAPIPARIRPGIRHWRQRGYDCVSSSERYPSFSLLATDSQPRAIQATSDGKRAFLELAGCEPCRPSRFPGACGPSAAPVPSFSRAPFGSVFLLTIVASLYPSQLPRAWIGPEWPRAVEIKLILRSGPGSSVIDRVSALLGCRPGSEGETRLPLCKGPSVRSVI